MLKKVKRRIIGVVISVSLICGSTLGVYAAYNDEVIVGDVEDVEDVDDGTIEIGNTRIETYDTSEGDTVFLQYVDGVLTQKNTIPHDQEDIVIREFFDGSSETISENSDTDVIHPSDYITVVEEKEVEEPVLARAATWTTKGTIQYRAATNSSIVYYGMRCLYTKTTTIGTYTINKYKGPLVDLITIVVSSVHVISKLIKKFLGEMCGNAGVTIVNGIIKGVLTTTVASENTDFKWKLIDTKDSKHYTYYTNGCRHHIIDSSYNTNKNYYEGTCPRKWGNQAMAVLFHDQLFGYTSYSVVSWN